MTLFDPSSTTSLPDLVSLQCFLSLSKHMSFKAAAHSVALSPAAFSDRIRRLEEDLGASLFERTTRRVKITELGVRLLPHATRLIQEARRWHEATREEGVISPYRLKVGTRFELGMSWLVPALTRLKANHPERSIHLKWGTDDDLIRMLLLEEIDAVISSVRVNAGPLRTAPLHREEYVFVAAPELGISNPSSADAPNLNLVDTEEHIPLFRYFLDALPSGERWQFREVEVMGTIGAIRVRVLEGAGVAVLPLYFVKSDLEAGRLVQLCPEVTLHHDFFRLIWHEDQPRASALNALNEELRDIDLS